MRSSRSPATAAFAPQHAQEIASTLKAVVFGDTGHGRSDFIQLVADRKKESIVELN